MTIQLYLNDTYLLHSEALIIKTSEDEKGIFLILDQTIFYPQGGGQPSDQGLIKIDDFEMEVTLVRKINDEIRHYITSPISKNFINQKIDCFVNKERRLLNSKFHTAAHLLGNIVEQKYPQALKAYKGHSFPSEAYVEFQGNEIIDSTQIQTAINEAIAKNSKITTFEIDLGSFEKQYYKLSYSIPENKKFRVMQIGNMLPTPCGGTHLSSVGEIESISVIKIKNKNNITRISYEVT